MHDSVATFYGGYDQVGLVRRTPLHLPWMAVVLGVAVLTLLSLIAADVAAYEARPASVNLTAVDWYAGSEPLTTSAGFTVHASQSFLLTLTCTSVCYLFSGASVSAPFVLLAFSMTNHPIQYVNVTVQAPASGFQGILTITLAVVTY